MQLDPERLLEIFLDLVRINGTAKNEKAVADYIQNFLANLNIQAGEDQTGQIIGGDTGNLVSKIHSGATDKDMNLSFAAHMDTVKPTSGIKPKIQDGRIVTDGNTILGADNRAGISMILYLVEYLTHHHIDHHPFEIVFTVGEETGLYGSTHLDLSMVDSRTIYILDSSADPGSFVYAAPGALDFEITFKGKASHAAVNPEQGVNALKMAAEMLCQFPIGKVDQDTTINFGKITGGEANNVVPPLIVLTGEIRSFRRENIDLYFGKLSEKIEEIQSMFGGHISVDTTEAFPSFILDEKCEAIKRLTSCMKAVGLPVHPIRYHGGSDANVLNSRGFTAIDLGIGAKNPHSTEEFIRIDDMIAIEKLIYHLIAI